MSTVSRAFSWRSTRRGASYNLTSRVFTEEQFSASLTVIGPFALVSDHLQALALLDETVGAWLRTNWAGAVMVPWAEVTAEDLPSIAKQWRCDQQPTAEYLTRYLLEMVAQPLLQGQNLLVHAVALKIGCTSYPALEADAGAREAASA